MAVPAILREPLRACAACALGAALVLASRGVAFAQPQPARSPSELTGVPVMPPRQRGSSVVDYPAGASGDGLVVLIVLVDSDGSVADVKPTSDSYSAADYTRVLDVTRQPNQKLSILYRIGQCDLRFA